MPQLRKTLAGRSGQQYWRSLDELADSSEFRQLLEREFPENASEWDDGVSRRNFMKLMGASLAFGGLTACTIQPEEKIVPWVRAPDWGWRPAMVSSVRQEAESRFAVSRARGRPSSSTCPCTTQMPRW